MGQIKIIVIGGGNVGGFIINNINDFNSEFEVIGILDDDLTKVGQELWGIKVLGQIKDLEAILTLHKEIGIVISIANPFVKEKIIKSLSQYSNIVFPNLIHKKTWISDNVKFGIGNIIYPGTSINYETSINNFVTINMNASLGHNCRLNDYVTISPGVNLAGFTNVGNTTFIGIGACVIQGIEIGNSSTVGAGAVIISDIPDGCTVVGNPGKVIKK